jgi:hypothetical protein
MSERPREAGVTDSEIRIGNLMPYSGSLEVFGAIGKAEAAGKPRDASERNQRTHHEPNPFVSERRQRIGRWEPRFTDPSQVRVAERSDRNHQDTAMPLSSFTSHLPRSFIAGLSAVVERKIENVTNRAQAGTNRAWGGTNRAQAGTNWPRGDLAADGSSAPLPRDLPWRSPISGGCRRHRVGCMARDWRRSAVVQRVFA